jgi:hypothetical protein
MGAFFDERGTNEDGVKLLASPKMGRTDVRVLHDRRASTVCEAAEGPS